MEINGACLLIPEGGADNAGSNFKCRRADFAILISLREQFRIEPDGSRLIRRKTDGFN